MKPPKIQNMVLLSTYQSNLPSNLGSLRVSNIIVPEKVKKLQKIICVLINQRSVEGGG